MKPPAPSNRPAQVLPAYTQLIARQVKAIHKLTSNIPTDPDWGHVDSAYNAAESLASAIAWLSDCAAEDIPRDLSPRPDAE